MKRTLQNILDEYMKSVPDVHIPCDRCLATERWDGSVVTMIVDAAFTSIGLNYFTSVVPAVEQFRIRYVEPGSVTCCSDLTDPLDPEFFSIWKNRRSWNVAAEVCRFFSHTEDDRTAFRGWAANADPASWSDDPVGRIRGVGINTFQYLRMMGGINTVMPDKIVKKVVFEIMDQAGISKKPQNDTAFVLCLEEMSRSCGYRPIDVCWMTWLVQSEGDRVRSKKYRAVLGRI